ncbi:MAG TPA: hypothetical protein VFF65_07570 [Phycisphaerales bacterium]|nr:hypothetical protein [Phycisphaerales bacterium]
MSSCCGPGQTGAACAVKSGAELRVRQAERACLCCICPDVSRDGRTCTVSGELVSLHIRGEWYRPVERVDRRGRRRREVKTCPRDRHPDGRGRVRLWRRVWLGVPRLARLWLGWALWLDVSQLPDGRLPRCGCLESLKLRWRWWRRRFRRSTSGT